MEKKKYLFIDGAYLRNRIKTISSKYYNDKIMDIDYSQLASGFEKIFYYDCIAPKRKNEEESDYILSKEEQIKHFNKLRSIKGFHVKEGETKTTNGDVKQKKVDIMIAVDMLHHSFNKHMEQAILFAGDLDFKPLIDALVLNGMYISLWYEKSSIDKNLKYASDFSRELKIRDFYNWCSKDFKKKHTMPYAISSPEINFDEKYFNKSGSSIDGIPLKLYIKDDVFHILFPDNNNEGYTIDVSFNDYDFLMKYIKDMYFDFKL